jgi:uncharacterized protein (DUF1015 family)
MEIRPFKAYRFNSEVVGNNGDCIAPPYDVINDVQQQHYYDKNPYNIVRITKAKSFAADNDKENVYTRAAKFFSDWIACGALKQDDKDAIYGYVQNFDINGKSFERFTFIAQGKMEEFGKTIRPHEQTLSKPKVDRLNLLNATKALFGLVYMIYQDDKFVADNIIKKAAAQKPLIDFVDEYKTRHRIYSITDKSEIDAIVKMMSDKSVIIADGHHRYETGFQYSKEHPEAKNQMLAFVNAKNEGLVILATHRVVSNLKNFNPAQFLVELGSDFDVKAHKVDTKKNRDAAEAQLLADMYAQYCKNNSAFGVYFGGDTFYLAVLKNPAAMDSAAPKMSKPWRSLDVAILQKLILDKLLGINEANLANETNLEYVKDSPAAVDETIISIENGKKQVIFFMNPTKIEQIQQVADQGEKMPQKSTFFYPKVYTGLTINKF